MDLSNHKEQVSFAYVRALAAIAGVAVEEHPYYPDDDSIDVRFRLRTPERRAQLEAQLKCTACEPLPPEAPHLPFDLPIKNYRDLIFEEMALPRLLIVVTVPHAQEDWAKHTEEELLLRRCAYFLSLRGMPASANQTTVRVHVPKANLLSPERLTELLAKISAGEVL